MKLLKLTRLAIAAGALALMTAGATFAADPLGTDDGTQLSMWVRAGLKIRVDPLVDAYNASHKNHINLTYIPTDDYQAKVGAAAAANALPDVFSADVVLMPNWGSAGLFQDLTSRINALPNIDKVAQAAIDVSTWDGKKYGMPFIADLSIWVWNKKLFKAAGLDPEKGPTSLAEFAADARAVAKLGNGVSGTFWGGSCGGCEFFTWFPIAWASGGDIMNLEGTESHANSDIWQEIYKTFRSMAEDGTALMPDTKTELGPTWTSYFGKGNIGVMPMPASFSDITGGSLPLEDFGVTPISGLKDGQSTLVGGDAIGVSRDSKLTDAAWNFIAWIQSDAAQIDVVAKNGGVVTRSDLADNKYSAADPRLVIFNQVIGKGQTPKSLNVGPSFLDGQGPWVQLLQDMVFGDASKLEADNAAINDSLNP
ncbi:MAG: extracellular solute-binding protein [Devosia sp.]